MKQVLIVFCLLFSFSSFSQDSTILKAFDFWVGEWDALYNDAQGNQVIAHNKITKDLGGSVIREEFSDPSTGLLGTSISVFSPADSLWHQAWADNSGGYIDLVGIVDGDIRIFQTKPVESGEQTIIRRMLFYNIQPNAFSWDWELSVDGGKTWKLAWQISYVRKK